MNDDNNNTNFVDVNENVKYAVPEPLVSTLCDRGLKSSVYIVEASLADHLLARDHLPVPINARDGPFWWFGVFFSRPLYENRTG